VVEKEKDIGLLCGIRLSIGVNAEKPSELKSLAVFHLKTLPRSFKKQKNLLD